MRTDITYIFGVAADSSGIVQHNHYHGEKISGGGFRATKYTETHREPASSYGASHVAPMPMKWSHQDEIGRIVGLVRRGGRLLAVGTTTELEPEDLAGLAEKYGELRWSTSTKNRSNEPLRIDEISLTPSPASIGLPSLRWYRFGVSKGNLPMWVKEALQRAGKSEYRFQHRGELQVFDYAYQRDPYSDVERFARDMGLIPSDRGATTMNLGGEVVPIEYRPGRITSVGGKPVR